MKSTVPISHSSSLAAATLPEPHPLAITPWLGMSLLQKAVRRGETQFALSAAATLFRDAPDKLWRRLTCVAFEDIGVADLSLCQSVLRVLEEKKARRNPRRAWEAIASLVATMCATDKCRAADDLLMLLDRDPHVRQQRMEFPDFNDAQLRTVVSGGGTLLERALALRFLAGTDRGPEMTLPSRRGNLESLFPCLTEAGIAQPHAELTIAAFRHTRSALPLMVALLTHELGDNQTEVKDDRLLEAPVLSALPAWVFDNYCREGRAALSAFLKGRSETARHINATIRQGDRVQFLGDLIFRVEGQRCRRRLRWRLADELRHSLDMEFDGPCGGGLLALAERELPELHALRALQAAKAIKSSAPDLFERM